MIASNEKANWYSVQQQREVASSSDSDMPSLDSSMSLVWSCLEQKLICECGSVELFGTPCAHIIRELSHMREKKLGCFDQEEHSLTALQLDDIQGYMAPE